MRRAGRIIFNGLTVFLGFVAAVMAALWTHSYTYGGLFQRPAFASPTVIIASSSHGVLRVVTGVEPRWVAPKPAEVAFFVTHPEMNSRGRSILIVPPFRTSASQSPPAPYSGSVEFQWRHYGDANRRRPYSLRDLRVVQVPWYAPTILFAVLPIIRLGLFLRRRSRRPAGTCPGCGYDLRATPDRCPECGRDVDHAAIGANTSP